MSIKRKFDALLERYNATVDRNESEIAIHINVDLPAGKTWACDNGLHTLVGFSYKGKGAMDSIYRDLVDRMEYGTDDCCITDCDTCEE